MTYSMKIREHELEARRYGKKLGNLEKAVSVIRAFRNKMNDDMLMQGLDIDKSTLENILNMIDNYPDWSDEDIAEEIIGD